MVGPFYAMAENAIKGTNDSDNIVQLMAGQETGDSQQLAIPTGKLAGKDIVAEADLDTALKEKVNAAAEGNHSHANKAFLDTLSGATDEEVTAMCTEVFGA